MSDPRGRLEKSALQAIDMKGIGLASAAMAITRSKEAFDAVKTQVSELGELESAASRSQAESATAAVALGNRVVATFGAVGIVLAALVTWQCVRLIDEPLSQAVAIAREVAAGNLDVQGDQRHARAAAGAGLDLREPEGRCAVEAAPRPRAEGESNLPSVPTKSVSQKRQTAVSRSASRPDHRLQPAKRQNTAGRPAFSPSPCKV